MSSISKASIVPPSVNQAIIFLTRPLIHTQSPFLVSSLQIVLQATIGACFDPLVDSDLTLTLSSNSLPPRPIFAACFASGMHWAEWMRLLGGRTFDLIIEAWALKVIYHGTNPQVETLWSERTPTLARRAPLIRITCDDPQVPISKLGQQSAMQSTLLATLHSAVARSERRAAYDLLEAKREEEEADEMLAMISKCTITTPSPTRENFIISPPTLIMPIATSFPPPLSSPESDSPSSSRPSSRSSTFSDFSSDNESNTSVSSASSFDFLASVKPSSTFAPRQKHAEPKVFIDNTKKEVTKYLYQGGVSTVLTGGVMLGGASAATPAKAGQAPKYRAPIGGKRTPIPKNAASANTWRRAPRA
ncbi:hypothetical protein CVT25_006797 [Psilocybe cyanescens]|uniref:Uncharacterized protein n=1 Tax=Psilocybe cyanescens TaxID=93625 RepID=A0A409X752_PSICY|nr:hypothetical protein CVT25_006797 [Psilocybe cyanescens]